MGQRNSGYERIAGDLYVTPRWVWEALYEVEDFEEPWDCAPANATFDFLSFNGIPYSAHIVTNPPFNLAEKFVRHSINLMKNYAGKVAMLLPMQWDAAKSRCDLFENPPFKAKYTLTKRIRWENLEQKKAGPSMNHAWYVWDWSYTERPLMGWLPKTTPLSPEKGAEA